MSVWAYVYERRQELPAGFEEWLESERAAIISIDMHRGHLDESPDCTLPAPRAREIIEPVNRFHDEARALGVPVVHVRLTLRRGGQDDLKGTKAAWRLTNPLFFGGLFSNADQHAIEGSRWTEFVTRVEPDDLVVNTKKRLTAFYPSDLDFLLRNMGIKAVVLTGIATEGCVLNTALDASNLGYRTVVLRDLVKGIDETLE